MATDIHAEHVGSLLRQPWLLAARSDYKDRQDHRGRVAGHGGPRGGGEHRGSAVGRDPGLHRREVRRTNWMTGILESIGGMSPVDTPMITWHRPDGEVPPEE